MLIERRKLGKLAVAGAAAGVAGRAWADTKPFTIGFGMALTGSLAPNGKSALLGMQIWEEDINARGGLLGRPVKLVYYDDASNPSNVPGIYTKLLDVDKVDIVTSGYATNMVAPAMPVVMQHDRTFFSLLGLAVNSEFHYPRYFSVTPTGGPNPKRAFSDAFFGVAMEQSPKPQTLAITGADAEFPRNALDGVRTTAKELRLKIVYDKTYPPPTTDFAPIIRAIQATSPDIAVFCSYPPDSVGIIRAISEVGFKAKIVGGAMVGVQATAIKQQLGPLLNGITNYETWVPAKTMEFPGVNEFLAKYQARAAAEGVDPLGYYLGTWGYAYAQLIEQAIKGAGGTDDEKLANYFRTATFNTILGPVKFGAGGEWAESRMIAVQYHGIKGNDLEQFKGMNVQTIVGPEKYGTGKMIYPYEKAK